MNVYVADRASLYERVVHRDDVAIEPTLAMPGARENPPESSISLQFRPSYGRDFAQLYSLSKSSCRSLLVFSTEPIVSTFDAGREGQGLWRP